MFVYKCEFKNIKDKKIDTNLDGVELNKKLKHRCLDINNLKKYDVRPRSIIYAIKENKLPVHIIKKIIQKLQMKNIICSF